MVSSKETNESVNEVAKTKEPLNFWHTFDLWPKCHSCRAAWIDSGKRRSVWSCFVRPGSKRQASRTWGSRGCPRWSIHICGWNLHTPVCNCCRKSSTRKLWYIAASKELNESKLLSIQYPETQTFSQQDSIPVGYVPPACQPYVF